MSRLSVAIDQARCPHLRLDYMFSECASCHITFEQMRTGRPPSPHNEIMWGLLRRLMRLA